MIRRTLCCATLLCALAFQASAKPPIYSCPVVPADMILSARTAQVDIYDAPNGKRIDTLQDTKFPYCLPVNGSAPNMMLQVTLNGAKVWVPPHMVNARLSGKKPAICRNLAFGNEDTKVGATRALGEDCPKSQQSKP